MALFQLAPEVLLRELATQGVLGIGVGLLLLVIWKGFWPDWRKDIEARDARFAQIYAEQRQDQAKMREDLTIERNEVKAARKELMDRTLGILDGFSEICRENSQGLRLVISHTENLVSQTEENTSQLRIIRDNVRSIDRKLDGKLKPGGGSSD